MSLFRFLLASVALIGGGTVALGEPLAADHLEDRAPEVVQAETLRQLAIGMTRHQIYHLIGEPHYARGVRARTWVYVYDIRRSMGVGRPLCQLDIRFEKGLVSELHWSNEACARAAE